MNVLDRYSVFMTALCVLTMMAGGNIASGGGQVEDGPVKSSSEWLIVLYMAGDNNLGRDGYEWGNAVKMDIEEMERDIPLSGTTVLALADMEGDGNTFLYNITRHATPGIGSPTLPLSNIDPSWTDEVDMSDWGTLKSFVEYIGSNYSADHTLFVLWDHGSGWYLDLAGPRDPLSRGFALDSTSGGGQMYLDDFRKAFMEAEKEVPDLFMDIIAFDTCYMGMAEVFYQMSPWFGIGIGSMDEQPWYGYNYSFISRLSTPGVPPVYLAQHIVSTFSVEYSAPGQYAYAAVTAVDLGVLRDEMAPAWNILSLSLLERMYYLEVSRNGLFGQTIGRSERIGIENSDMGSFLKELAEGGLQINVTENALLAMSVYDRMVLDSWVKPDGRNPEGTGMSVYLPMKNLGYKGTYDGSSLFLNFTADTLWDEMLHEYRSPVERVRVYLETGALDGDMVEDDLSVNVTNPAAGGHPISGAELYMNGTFAAFTDQDGRVVFHDLTPGYYHLEARNATHVGFAEAKVLNRVPFAAIYPGDITVHEAEPFILSSNRSFDPDNDKLTFRWDTDDRDGLDDNDSTSPSVEAVFFDQGTRTVRLRVNDSVAEQYADAKITVVNLPPVASVSTPQEVLEDQDLTLEANGSYDTWPDSESLMYRFSLDGTNISDWTSSDSMRVSFDVSGLHEATVFVRDPDGEVGHASVTVDVSNVGPNATIIGPSTGNEDEVLSFNGLSSWDTPSDLARLLLDWSIDGGATFEHQGGYFNRSFNMSGTQRIYLRASDDDGSTSIAEKYVAVQNLPPLAAVNGPHSVLEDEGFTLDASGSLDTPSDLSAGLSFSWDLDMDGTFERTGATVDLSLPAQGSHLVALRAIDNDGAISLATHVIEVRNRAPTPVLNGSGRLAEDDVMEVYLEGGVDSPSDMASLRWKWYVDGELYSTNPEVPELTFSVEGNHSMEVVVMDDQGAEGSDAFQFEVYNPPPTAVLEGAPSKVKVGRHIDLKAFRSSDTPSDAPVLSFEWYLNGELIEGEGGRNLTIEMTGTGSKVLTVRVTDDEGGFSEASVEVTVVDGTFLEEVLPALVSWIGLLAILMILFIMALVVFQIFRKVRDLPSPDSRAGLDGEVAGGPPASMPSSGPSLDPDEKTVVGGSGTSPSAKERISLLSPAENGPHANLPDPEGLHDAVEIPAAPDIEPAVVPPIEDGLLES